MLSGHHSRFAFVDFLRLLFLLGCVQEEIFFATHPELLLLRFFQQRLSVNETCAMSGAMKFSRYAGYGDSFTCLLNSSSSSSSESKNRSLTLRETEEEDIIMKEKRKASDVSDAVLSSSLSSSCSLPSSRLGAFLRSKLGDLQGVENVDCRPLFVSFLSPSCSSLTQDRREEEGEDVQEEKGRRGRRNEEEKEKRVVQSIELCTLITGLDAQRYAGVGSAGGGQALLPFHQYEVFQMLREINKVISALTFSPEEDEKYEVYIHQNYCHRFDQLHQKYMNSTSRCRFSSSPSSASSRSSSDGDAASLARSSCEKRQQEKEKEQGRDEEEEEHAERSVDSEETRRLKRPFVTGKKKSFVDSQELSCRLLYSFLPSLLQLDVLFLVLLFELL